MENKEMEVLFAEKEVTICGETLTIKPYSWMQSMKAVQPIGVLMHALVSHIDDVESILQADDGGLLSQVDAVADLAGKVDIDQVGEALLSLMTLATGKPRPFIEGLMIDDAVALGMAVYEVNKHFFKERLAKMKLPGAAKQ